MTKSAEVRDTEGKGIGIEGKATGKGIDLPKKIRSPVERSWWAWARAQDRIRETGAYKPTKNVNADVSESTQAQH